MIRIACAAAAALVATGAIAATASRWTSVALEGANSLVVAGRDDAALIVLRGGSDPIRSFDGGTTWTPFRVAGRPPEVLTSLIASPVDSRTWHAVADGIGYLTEDGGDTWTAVGAEPGIAFGADPKLMYAFRLDRTRFCFPDGSPPISGLRVSIDGGRTWQDRDAGASPGCGVHRLYPSPVDARVVFHTAFSGLYRSDDQGLSWKTVTPPFSSPSQGLAGMTLTLDRRDPGVAYVNEPSPYAYQPDALAAIWATSDGGATWTQREPQPGGILIADPLQAKRVYLATSDGGIRESRGAGATWVQAEKRMADRTASPAAEVVAALAGRRVALDLSTGHLRRLDLTDGALALGSDLWWNPAESGAGLTITQHASSQAFVVWYAYDATGAPVWRFVPGGTWQDRTFSGEMFETTGPPYFLEAFDPSRIAVRPVGTMTLRFDDENNALMAHSLGGGPTGEKRITRQLFAPAAPATAENFADLWWNAAESGWGIAISHQYNSVFATWYAYGDDGKPLWIVMPDAIVGNEFLGAIVRPVASGDIYAARGPAAGGPFDPAQVVLTKVGTATLHFRATQEAILEYSAFGRTATRTITRQPF